MSGSKHVGPWPPGYEPESDLSGDGRVLRAHWRGTDVVVRRAQPGSSDEVRAEFDVLSSVRHPGLAHWTDHGVFPDGQAFVARSWVEGVTLDRWIAQAELESIGTAIAGVSAALAELHRNRFLHGDLKPANILIDRTNRPILTDFGLARSFDAGGAAVSGSAFFIAPERLLGAPASAASDQFALGVLLYTALGGSLPTSDHFYARFPTEPFLAVVAGEVEELPPWSRDLVANLVSRDPARRPDAATVTELLARRLGLEVNTQEDAPRLPFVRGRETWFDERAASRRHEWIEVPESETCEAVADALAVHATRREQRVARIDGRLEVERLTSLAALDAWVDARLAAAPEAKLIVTLERATPWTLRSVEHLARACNETSTTRVAICAPTAPPASSLWARAQLPNVTREVIATFLDEIIEDGPGDRCDELAKRLAKPGVTTNSRLNARLVELVCDGRLRRSESKWQLLPGDWTTQLDDIDSAPLELGSSAARLCRAIEVVIDDDPRIGTAVRLSGLSPDEARSALRELESQRVVRVLRGPTGRLLERLAARPSTPDATRTGLRRRWHEELIERGSHGDVGLPHAFGLGLSAGSPETLANCVRELREQDEPERALDLVERCMSVGREEGRATPVEALYEYALAWCTFGELERSERLAAELEDRSAPALAKRVRAHVALARNDYAEASQLFTRARSEDARDQGDSIYGEVRVLFEAHRDDEVIARVEALDRGDSQINRRARANMRLLAAMSHLRAGRLDVAGTALERELDAARARQDSALEAVTLLNLAALERRRGARERAVELLKRAVDLQDHNGRLAAGAQARAMLGRSLRDVGRPADSIPVLLRAARTRERLGDRAGASAARGMAGLSWADRGHVHSARSELEAGARMLTDVGRRIDAELFWARHRLLEARVARNAFEAPKSSPHDPRITLWNARAAWLQGNLTEARTQAAWAARLASELGQLLVGAEARAVCAWLDAEDPPRSADGAVIDIEIVAWLSSANRAAQDGLELLAQLEHAGRDDRAARVLLALASEAPDATTLDAFVGRALACFERCAAGLSRAERSALRRNLLARPDPRPSDLRAFEHIPSETEDEDMDVLALLDINHRLLEDEQLETLLGTIVEEAMRVCSAERGFLVLEEKGKLSFDKALDSLRGDIGKPDLEVSRSIVERALAEGAPLRIGDAMGDPSFGGARSVAELRLRSVLCAPFRVREEIRGVIYIDHRGRPAAFGSKDERLLGLLADQAGLAIRQRLLHDQLKHANQKLSRQVARRDSELDTARRALKVVGIAAPASGIVGSSAVMRTVHEAIARAAPTTLPVLVHGASGTGKELCARAIHAQSQRKDKPFVVENCAALPASLIESELFGFRRGAFTGANEDRAGLFERADRGTLFLDEIGELPLELQAKLLRVLETGEVRRLGDAESRTIDARLVTATNRDLPTEVEEGRFRADLFYRLDGLSIRMPALEEHVEDIPELALHFLRLDEARTGTSRRIAPEVSEQLCRRPWPGNVRELANEVARLIVLSPDDLVDPSLVRDPGPKPRPSSEPARVVPLQQLEREAILRALEVTGGDKRAAAELLGISRAKIYQRLKAWEDENGD